MKVKLRAAVALVLCIFTLICAGCMGARSPDEYGYALIIGIDQGKEKTFSVSMLLQRGNGGSESKEGNLCPLVSVECEDLFEAIELIESGLPFALSLSRTTAIVFGEDAARSGKLEQLLSASLGTLHIRYYANLITVRGKARDFLTGIQSELNPNVAKLQYNFVEFSNETGYVPAITLAQFYDRAWNEAGDIVLPLGMLERQKDQASDGDKSKSSEPTQVPKTGTGKQTTKSGSESSNENPSKSPIPAPTTDLLGSADYLPGQTNREGGLDSGLLGCALFHGTKLQGFLNGPHTQLLLMATGKFHKGRILLPDPEGRLISVLLQSKGQPRTTIILGEQPQAHISLALYASVEQPASVSDNSREELTAYFANYLQNEMLNVFNACRDIGCDSFQLGKAAVMQFTDTQQWEAYNWPEFYKNTQAYFSVEILLEYNPTHSRLE